jgi:hypothetical protein
MSILTCRNCEGVTNTTVCDHINSTDGKADKCYLKWEEKWVKGCSYATADKYTKPFCDSLLGETNV